MSVKDCDCTRCAYAKKHPQLNAPRCWHVTADTITDEQIEALRLESSEDGAGATLDDDYYEAAVMLNMCDEALGTIDYGDTFTNLPMAKALELTEQRRQWSRDRCAKILNARRSA